MWELLRRVNAAGGSSAGLGAPHANAGKVAAIALANKLARMAWAMIARATTNPSRSRRKHSAQGSM